MSMTANYVMNHIMQIVSIMESTTMKSMDYV